VIDPKLVTGDTGIPADRMWTMLRTDGQMLLDTAASGVPPSLRPLKFLREGTSWREIVQSAREWPADLIVVGTHHRSGLTRLLAGSTAEEIARHASTRVLVVPTPSATGVIR
jgi:nucleotide-binding universal stress UspA family protein